MKKTPCEDLIWNLLPIIRKEIACCLLTEFSLSQKETARKMGLTPAAICQYECNKRGKSHIKNDGIKKEIMISATKIAEQGELISGVEICRICNLIKSKGNLCDII